ncbi:hypothetical protein DUI87_12413 [Hirundo rustica rustica]|uniref:Uncharacterized protein n=1 Tax=Hirundo rustica rustica TaxID=333673 RepID=A0A3M0KC22_HIRRU|nr:hypothetical protein DUI87_12413 [Hirundo rustica rustica]
MSHVAQRKQLLEALFEKWDSRACGSLELEEVVAVLSTFEGDMGKEALMKAKEQLCSRYSQLSRVGKLSPKAFQTFLELIASKFTGNEDETIDNLVKFLTESVEQSPTESLQSSARRKWLQDIQQAAESSGTSMEPVYKAVIRALSQDMEAHGDNKKISAYIALLEENQLSPEQGQVCLRYVACTEDDAPHVLNQVLHRDMKGISFAAIDQGKPIYVPKVQLHGNIHFWNSDCPVEERKGSVLVLPLYDAHWRAFGILGLDTLRDQCEKSIFLTHEITFYEGVCHAFSKAYHHVCMRENVLQVAVTALDWLYPRTPSIQTVTTYLVAPGKDKNYALYKVITTDNTGQKEIHSSPAVLLREENLLRDYLFKCKDSSEVTLISVYGEHHIAVPLHDLSRQTLGIFDISIGQHKKLPPQEQKDLQKMLKMAQAACSEILQRSLEETQPTQVLGIVHTDKLDDNLIQEIYCFDPTASSVQVQAELLLDLITDMGLLCPKSCHRKTLFQRSSRCFADESDEEPTVGESLQREALKKQAMKQTKLEIQKALEEDATVYEYDSIYDEMQQKKKESSAKMFAGNDDKKPRYIHNILKAAEIRKKEQERRMERKIQKEREMEGGEFADKEAFVTSAYKKKLQERAEEEERERRQSALEAYLDVTKQRDLSGFYRHLLNQRVGEEEMPKCSFREARIKEEKPDSQDEPNERNKSPSERQRVKPSKKENNPDADTDLETDSSDDDKRHKHSKVNLKKKKRRENSVSSEEEVKHHKSQRHSRSPSSSSVEEEPRTKAQASHQRGESRPSKRGSEEQYREKDYERSRTHEKDHQREREERHRHGDHTNRDHYRRREDQDDKQRGKERKEREGHGKEWRRAKEREEKGSEKEREKEKTRNDKDRYNDREKERGEKYREREDHTKERREKYGSDEKKYRERRESTPTSLEKDGESDLGKEKKGKDREGDEKASSSSGMSEQKRKAGEGGEKDEKEQAQKAPGSLSKFAKRSNEETVMSARDRYLARQMARVSTKPYIEKEED